MVAAEAQLNQSTGEATFRGHARLWQQTNSVSGPVIVLNQHLQTLVARSSDPAEPVRAVLLSAGGAGYGHSRGGNRRGASLPGRRERAMRARSGSVGDSRARRRSEVLRRRASGGDARRHAGRGGCGDRHGDIVVRCGGTAADAGGKSRATAAAQAQVDRMTATGHVVLTFAGHGAEPASSWCTRARPAITC